MVAGATKTRSLLSLIVIAQFACASLWFAGNAAITSIIQQFHLTSEALGHLVSVVQLGFIAGTLLFAIFTVSDRYSPAKVFFCCAIAGAASNLLIFAADGLPLIMVSRFLTGFFLAGIYPVGMKIASDHSKQGLGKALGYLVGALVLGTAFPHLINSFSGSLSWKTVMIITSALAVTGGCIIYFCVPGQNNGITVAPPDLMSFVKVFSSKKFRAATFGYFGHMWELYAFWAFLPAMLSLYAKNTGNVINISLLSFLVIAAGAVSCVIGGYLSKFFGSRSVAFTALAISGACCAISPFLFQLSLPLFLFVLFIWGMAVTADSPQFSTLVAQAAPVELKGTALTISTSVGFLITVVSIELLNSLRTVIDPASLYLVLVIGPVLGLIGMIRLTSEPAG